MLQQQIQRKQKNFALQRGLYVVRYEAAIDASQPPLVSILCEAGRNEVILHPEQSRPTMSAPGQALVLRAMETGSVQVEISSAGALSTLDATLKFEPLRRDMAPAGIPELPAIGPAAPYLAAAPAPMPAQPVAIQILGHVARLGDVNVGPDEWLGGPSAPARIEGFLVRWSGRPAGVQLRYAATVAGQRPGEARLADLDEFTGTRGRGRAVLGFMMELVGPDARNYALNVEALFLGSPARRFSGQSVTAGGPSGREPLVGLRISIASQLLGGRPGIAAQKTQAPAASANAGAAPNATVESRNVRVFRG